MLWGTASTGIEAGRPYSHVLSISSPGAVREHTHTQRARALAAALNTAEHQVVSKGRRRSPRERGGILIGRQSTLPLTYGS